MSLHGGRARSALTAARFATGAPGPAVGESWRAGAKGAPDDRGVYRSFCSSSSLSLAYEPSWAGTNPGRRRKRRAQPISRGASNQTEGADVTRHHQESAAPSAAVESQVEPNEQPTWPDAVLEALDTHGLGP